MTALTPGIAGVGTIVKFVLDSGLHKGEVRPAIIVKIWNNTAIGSHATMVQLQVFTDSTNDYPTGPGSNGLLWVTSAHYSQTGEPRTWHLYDTTTHTHAKESSS